VCSWWAAPRLHLPYTGLIAINPISNMVTWAEAGVAPASGCPRLFVRYPFTVLAPEHIACRPAVEICRDHHAGAYPVQIRVIGSNIICLQGDRIETRKPGLNPCVGYLVGVDPKTSRISRKSHHLKKDSASYNSGVVALDYLD